MVQIFEEPLAFSYFFEENSFRFLSLTKHKKCSTDSRNTNLNIQKWLEAITLPTVNVKTCTATNVTIVIMTTEIISLVLLVLMVIVMYFVMKIYSILRVHECSFHPVHDTEMDAATKRTELQGGVAARQRRTLIWMAEKYENTSRVPQEHDERNKEVSELKSVKKKLWIVLSSSQRNFHGLDRT